MQIKNSLWVVFLSASVLTVLFYKQGIGLNLLLFEVLFIGWLFFSKQLSLTNTLVKITLAGMLLTGVFTVVTYSIYVYVVHFFALFLFIGVLNFQTIRSLFSGFGAAFISLFISQIAFAQQFFSRSVGGVKVGKVLWRSRIFIIPVLIIVVFLTMYGFSNPIFGEYLGAFGDMFQNIVSFIFENLNISLVFTFLLCAAISIFLWYRIPVPSVEKHEQIATEDLQRNKIRRSRFFKLSALKSEYKAGIFLLVTLNLLLLFLNILDIYLVWFNFEWDGETLKQFVHEGTYLLIVSILISIAVVLYFFRGNLNFYHNNKWLKYLAYAWIAQNAILAISVAIRNFWYINYFALAYKRIGVILFLLLVLYGLFTVFRKIQHTKTSFYLFQKNTLALYLILVLSSLIPWDSVIAKYNFAHADSAYLHLEYLSTLSDKALPHLTKTKETLDVTYNFQQKKYPYPYFTMTHQEYLHKIASRNAAFAKKWENKNFLSWNLVEYLAYQKLEPQQ
ncbi:DUF4153 domain-containing protein [Rasiella sp. SM2506]|uniref:DUF4153 domain-containing protein n=1 Tax=Rasiella sp. SM2506 TaxID=3423914 RepID=UPI003D7BA59D